MRIKVIERQGGAALVEWLDGDKLHRATVPSDKLKGDSVSKSDLTMGVPYGEPWAELLTITATSEQLEQELYRRGLWTGEDIRRNPEAAKGALMTVIGIDFAALLRAARR